MIDQEYYITSSLQLWAKLPKFMSTFYTMCKLKVSTHDATLRAMYFKVAPCACSPQQCCMQHLVRHF